MAVTFCCPQHCHFWPQNHLIRNGRRASGWTVVVKTCTVIQTESCGHVWRFCFFLIYFTINYLPIRSDRLSLSVCLWVVLSLSLSLSCFARPSVCIACTTFIVLSLLISFTDHTHMRARVFYFPLNLEFIGLCLKFRSFVPLVTFKRENTQKILSLYLHLANDFSTHLTLKVVCLSIDFRQISLRTKQLHVGRKFISDSAHTHASECF